MVLFQNKKTIESTKFLQSTGILKINIVALMHN